MAFVRVWNEETEQFEKEWEDEPTEIAGPPAPPPSPGVLQQITENPVLNPLGPVGRAYQQMMQGGQAPSAGGLAGIAASAALPLVGGVAGRALLSRAPLAGETIGGALGQAGNWLTGINPMPQSLGQAARELAAGALPGIIASKASQASRVGPWLKRQIATTDPALGTALAEETGRVAQRGIGEMSPLGISSSELFDKLRQQPGYKGTETIYELPPSATKMPPTAGLGKDIGVGPIAGDIISETRGPIHLSESGRLAKEYADTLSATRQAMPGLAAEYGKAARLTEVAQPYATFETVHNSIRAINELLDSPQLTGDVERALKRSRAALYRDLQSSPLAPELRVANETFARETAVRDLNKVVDMVMKTKGETEGALADTMVEALKKAYEKDDFMQAAINPIEITSLLNDIRKIGVEQAQMKSGIGSLAQYGAYAGAGGGLGAAGAMALGLPPAIGGTVGSLTAMLTLRGINEAKQRAAYSANPAARQAALKAFRSTPGPALTPQQLTLPAHLGTQSIAEMFLRRRGIDSLLQPTEEPQY